MMITVFLTIVWFCMWYLATLAGKMNRFDLLCLDVGLAYYIIVLRPTIRAKKSKENVDD